MLCKKLHIYIKNLPVVIIRIDHRREFDQDKFINYCDKNDISQHLRLLNKMELLKGKKTVEDM